MARKSKDIYDEPEATLEDFVIPEKVTAFVNTYEPLDHWTEDCDTFTDYQLRSYFKAVVCPLGDPLALYIFELNQHGFKFINDACGEPVIYARPR